MKLLMDIGNSRIKWAYLAGRELKNPEAYAYKNTDIGRLLKEKLALKHKADQVFIANVAGQEAAEAVSIMFKDVWNITPVFASVEREFEGVTNAYEDVSQLGIDRWLAVVAAWTRYRSPACIVSCGTAVTIDGISGSGQHLGGFILPGLELMQSRLINETRGIRTEPGNKFLLHFGRSTAECVNNGSVRAIVSIIDNIAEELAENHGGKLSCIITGGYAGQIAVLLGRNFDHDSHLVLSGLAKVAENAG